MGMSTSWRRLALAGASVVLTGLLVACGGDDNGDSEGATGTNGDATATPSATSTPNNETTTGSTGPGGATGGSAGAPQTPPGPPSFPVSDSPPVTTASANGESVETGIGTYCWTRMCVDKIGVPTQGTLTVTQGDKVMVAVPDGVPGLREASANVFEAVDAMPLDDGSEIWPYPGTPGEPIAHVVTDDGVVVTVDMAPGRYVLALSMFFEAGSAPDAIFAGDVVYGVLLEVQ